MNPHQVRNDFDEIARLTDHHRRGTDRYESFLLSLIPPQAVTVLDVGCGLGQFAARLADGVREVVGVDLSPEMIARARRGAETARQVSFICADFLEHDFGSRQFDCVFSSATLHHVSEEVAVPRMVGWLRPGGRLIIHDLRSDNGILDRVRSLTALAQDGAQRLIRTGWPRSPRAVRDAWLRHGAGETYLTLREARALAERLLPGSRIYSHRFWRYTIVWDKSGASLNSRRPPRTV
jgi:SAM-dependent methyltransferase